MQISCCGKLLLPHTRGQHMQADGCADYGCPICGLQIQVNWWKKETYERRIAAINEQREIPERIEVSEVVPQIIYTVMFEELLEGSYSSLDSAIKGIRQQVDHDLIPDDEPIIQQEMYDGTKLDEWEFWSYTIRKSELF